jgi:hypothetical protein
METRKTEQSGLQVEIKILSSSIVSPSFRRNKKHLGD